MKLLISGGAGYIGSYMVRYAQERGHEVQSGSYLGEDDIVRFEDRYGR